MWFDTHCHLDAAEFDADRAVVIDQAVAAGVTRIVVPAVAVNNFAAVAALCARHPAAASPAPGTPETAPGGDLRLYPAYGIHPMYTPQARDGDVRALGDWLKVRLLKPGVDGQRPVALGEIGLDGFVQGLDMARQEVFLAEQLKLAVDFDLPVILHIRRAQDLVLKHLRRFQAYFRSRGEGRAGVAHAFNGSRQQADTFIDLGFVLGFGGAMTYEGSTRIRTLASELPLEFIVLETDAPDIPPAWLAGRRNSPAEVPRIGAALAGLRGVAPTVIATATADNATRLFAPH